MFELVTDKGSHKPGYHHSPGVYSSSILQLGGGEKRGHLMKNMDENLYLVDFSYLAYKILVL